MSPTDDKSLEAIGGDAWRGFRFEAGELITPNGESLRPEQVESLIWERNNWRLIAQAAQRDLAKTGMQGAVVFPLEELNRIREALRLLDARLPGLSMQIVETSRRRRA